MYLEYGLVIEDGDVNWNAADPGWAYGLFCAIVARIGSTFFITFA